MGKRQIPAAWLADIEKRLLNAEAPADFVPDLSAQWKRSTRQVWKYVARVRAKLAERAKGHDPETDREIIRAMLLDAYRTARAGTPKFGPDGKTMVQAAKVLGELTGAMAPKKIAHAVDGLAGLLSLAFSDTTTENHSQESAKPLDE